MIRESYSLRPVHSHDGTHRTHQLNLTTSIPSREKRKTSQSEKSDRAPLPVSYACSSRNTTSLDFRKLLIVYIGITNNDIVSKFRFPLSSVEVKHVTLLPPLLF
jgi:hypothetical protein